MNHTVLSQEIVKLNLIWPGSARFLSCSALILHHVEVTEPDCQDGWVIASLEIIVSNPKK